MRSLKLVSFYAMRMRRVVPVVCAVMLVVMLGTLISLNALTEKVTQYDLDGAQLVAREVNANVNFGFDYIGAFTVLAWAIALAIATSERRLLASMGASNWEWLLSLVLYSALQAVVFTLFSVLLGALGRSAMMLMGMEASTPWSAQLIFTGGRENFWQDCLYGAANMLRRRAPGDLHRRGRGNRPAGRGVQALVETHFDRVRRRDCDDGGAGNPGGSVFLCHADRVLD